MKFIPNIVTLVNLFGGTVAIVLALRGLPHYAGLVIFGCMVLDFLDGALARLLNARSKLGVQLDSLADLVSFGVAPATIVFHYLSMSVFGFQEGLLRTILPFAAFILTVFSALRLARFNIEENQSDDFQGLPTPASAFFFASWPIVLFFFPERTVIYSAIITVVSSLPYLLLIVLFFSVLMVSKIPMFSLKIKGLGFKENKIRLIFLGLILLSVIFFGMPAIVLVIIFYIILSLTTFLFSN
jgi:CDP-diacylglycerol--serine O-phosphatidyltransferase